MITILHTNDMHGTLPGTKPEAIAKLEKLRTLRAKADFYFDTGDCIKAGNLSIPLKKEPVWPMLAELNCTASVLGNRETHLLTSAFEAKIAGATHPILCGNLKLKDETRPLPSHLIVEKDGVKIGIISGMVAMVTPTMRTEFASQYLWDPPVQTLMALALLIRPRVDLLIAITHIGISQDRHLAERAPQIDIILGGHSHTVLQEPEKIGKTYICQGGSHNRFAGLYQWDASRLTGELVPL